LTSDFQPFLASCLAKLGLFFGIQIYDLWRQNPAEFDVKIFKKGSKKLLNSVKKDANFFAQNSKFINFDVKILPNLTPIFLPNQA
jgi:hypothetical protein